MSNRYEYINQLEGCGTGMLTATAQLNELILQLDPSKEDEFMRGCLLDIQASLARLVKDMTNHIKLEENIFFPFVSTHIPRLDMSIHLLKSEHGDIFNELSYLDDALIRGLKSSQGCVSDVFDELHKIAACLMNIVRHHVNIESRSMHMAIFAYLKPRELNLLNKKLDDYSLQIKS
ncbi:MAG: iron-sulfur cluster repair protein YtfE (RIC family) [Candidatus Omnitrophota bacterium]|jgi:iron-sulfur cluster repair protein YtfE (RIC family)